MKHNDNCTKWPDYHPYDCPECVVLNELEERLDTEYENKLMEIEDEAEKNGYDEGQRDCEYTHDDLIDGEFDKGWDAGYAECRKDNNLGD